MLISPPIHLTTRAQSVPARWELGLRYGAATLATLLAVGGAQLYLPNKFIVLLAMLTLGGVPVSLYLRLNDMHVAGVRIPRLLLNAITVTATFIGAFYIVFHSLNSYILPLLSGSTASFWVRFGASEPVGLLMQAFLLFAAIRSFALITDKDATLSTVPSFSVLLLLIPLHHGLEIVIYFLVWAVVAATLFALDHRSEARANVTGTIPPLAPGQDTRLAARSLATVLGFSILSAIGISYLLTLRDANERSTLESAISSLTVRLTSFISSSPSGSVNSGPERQIDFSSSPTLPSKAQLWVVSAQRATTPYGDRTPVYVPYWRMFTLDRYDGQTWSQDTEEARRVPLEELHFWPRRPPGSGGFPNWGSFNPQPPPSFRAGFRLGFEIQKPGRQRNSQFNPSGTLIFQQVKALVPNLGYLPALPPVRSLRLPDSEQKEVRARSDGAIDVGVMEAGQTARLLSFVPPIMEYGAPRTQIPDKKPTAAQIAKFGVSLPPLARRAYLQLPTELPARVRRLGASILKGVSSNESNFRRANRLSLAIQRGAMYTLRPPIAPTGRDATDFFLFEGQKRGYCTHFAGALTILCRTQGIPARVVSGFAGMEADSSQQIILREANAHAWTEVWVDGWGWAVVDATLPDDRGDNSPTWIQNLADLSASTLLNIEIWASSRSPLIFCLGAALALASLVYLRGRRLQYFGGSTNSSVADDFERRSIIELYQRTTRRMSRFLRPKTPWETPDEWLQSFGPHLSGHDIESLRRLTALYLAATYAAKPLPKGSARLARHIMTNIAWKRLPRA